MGAEAKSYLEDHSIPQLFEGLITGLVYNKPEDPLSFLESAIAKVRENPDQEYSWDMFNENLPTYRKETSAYKQKIRTRGKRDDKSPRKAREKDTPPSRASTARSGTRDVQKRTKRLPSLSKAAEVAKIPEVPIVLFMGGPGGGKTKYAAKVRDALEDEGLVHICMPDLIRSAITKYKDTYPEWKEASERFRRGELISNNLALDLIKAEMGRNQQAKVFFLEGFPREARQVEDFEREVRLIDMVMILDYDEITLRRHMELRGLDQDTIEQKIRNFKLKTLPSAKYFDEQRLLHLIPGEAEDEAICARMKKLIRRAMECRVPLSRSTVSSRRHSPTKSLASPTALEAEIVARETGMTSDRNSRARSGVRSSRPSSRASKQSGSYSSQKVRAGNEVASSPLPNGDLVLSLESSPRQNSSSLKSVSATFASTSAVTAAAVNDVPQEEATLLAEPDAEVEPVLQPESKAVAGTNSKLLPEPTTEPAAEPEPKPGPTSERSNSRSGTSRTVKSVASVKSLKSVVSVGSLGSVRSENPTAPDVAENEAPDDDNVDKKEEVVEQPVASKEPGLEAPLVAESEEVVELAEPKEVLLAKSEDAKTVEPEEATLTKSKFAKAVEPEGILPTTTKPMEVFDTKEAVQETNKQNGTAIADEPSGADMSQSGGTDEIESVIFVIGPPGANKAEIARRISMKFEGFDVYSMGALLRQKINRNRNDPLWQKVGEKMNKGEMVPDEICREVLFTKIQEDASSWGYVIEGYPRTETQAKDFEEQFKRLDLAVLLDCTEQYCKDSLKKRFDNAVPATQRADDAPNVVATRLSNFKQNTLPMLKHLDAQGKLRVVDGDADIDKIFYEISSIIESTIFSEDYGVRSSDGKPANFLPQVSKEAKTAVKNTPSAKKAEPVQTDAKSKSDDAGDDDLFSLTNKAAVPASSKGVFEDKPQEPDPSLLENIGFHLSSRDGPFPSGLPNASPCLLVIGPPGSNKKEISRRITMKYEGFKSYSMGGLLRARIKANANDELWVKVCQTMDAGKLIIDEICRGILYSNVYATGASCQGYVFEGYPRTPEQAIDFEKQFERVDLALLIDCTEEYCRKSLAQRREAAGDKSDRKDDSPEIVSIRLSVFKQHTLPMVKHFDEKGKLRVVIEFLKPLRCDRLQKSVFQVDGDADIDKIFYEVCSIIDSTVSPS